MTEMNYVVTCHKPSKVTHSCVGNFTSMEYINLVLAKGNRLEIHQITSDGIELISDVPINGRIVSLELFHPREGPLDLLFILTENYKTCVLQWNVNSSEPELITRSASMDITPECKEPLNDQICTVDPDCRVIGLLLCMDLCKVVPLDNIGQLEEPFDFKLRVKDIKFLYGCEVPTVAVLCQDAKGTRHAKMYEVPREDGVPATGTWSLDHLDCGAGLLIPVPTPLCGFLIIGEEQAVYCGANTFIVISKPHFTTKAYERVDGSRFLLGDGEGGLHLLVVTNMNQRVTDATFEVLGETSIASTISYLGNSLVFVGSSCGDSQLVKVELDAHGSGIQVLKHFVNLGPINDLCLVDLEKHGQNQIVTCSGSSKDGSLRIVCKVINEQASVEHEGILGLWSLKSSIDEAADTFLVVSFISDTHILAMNREDELVETEIKGFLSQVQTLFCHDAVFNQLLQVTSSSIRLVSSTTRELRDEWDAPDGLTINIATANASQVLLATEERYLFFIEVGDGTLRQVSRIQLDHATSCLNLNSIGDNPIALVGKWTEDTVEIRQVPCLTVLIKMELGSNIIPRSVLLCAFQGISYLLCGLGDGNLIIFQLDKITGAIVDTKRVSLGTQPLTLHTFSWENAEYVFVASDRPATIYSRNKKLFINALDLGDVTHMCQFNLAAFPDSIAIATRGKLTIGSIDPTQKLHIRTIPLREFAHCICHQTQTSTYGVCTTKNSEMQFVRLFEDETFNALSAYKLHDSESGECIVSCLFTGDSKEYYCVGTKSPLPYVTSETKGRLLVFSVENGQLQLIFEQETTHAVISLKSFGGKLLASWGSKIQVYNWTRPELQHECECQTKLDTKHVQTHGNLVLTADEIDTIRICVYKPGGELEHQARYYNDENNKVAAVGIMDSSIYLTGDNLLNLCTMTRDSGFSSLELVGQYHLGDCVNIFCRLVDSKIIFGTSSGMLGVIVSLTTDQYQFLEDMQTSMRSRIAAVGGLSHKEWRSSRCLEDTNFIDGEDTNFIDGDMIESFLELNKETKEMIAKDVSIPLKQLCETVEELKRLH